MTLHRWLACAFLTTLIFGNPFDLATAEQIKARPAAKNPDQILKEALSELPEKKLTLPLMFGAAVKSASSFKALKANFFNARATKESATARLDWVTTADYSILKSEAEAANSFSPTSQESKSWSLGLGKTFTTGTTFGINYGSTNSELGFTNAAFNVAPYFENKVSISLSQNLWADFFGNATRNEFKAALTQSASEELAAQEAIENWSVGFIGTYYQAWFKQNQFFAAKDNLARRKKLLDVTNYKANRGTAEGPDVLQIKAAWLLAQNNLLEAQTELDKEWRTLVISLGLPEDWLLIDPSKIPIDLDAMLASPKGLCQSESEAKQTLAVQRAKKALEAAEFSAKRSSSLLNPKLQLVGSYATNGIDDENSSAQEEAIDGRHPSWSVGVKFEMPIGSSSQKAEYLRSRAGLIAAQSKYTAEMDGKKIEFQTVCDVYAKSLTRLENARQAFQAQEKRLRQQESRFRLGRTTTFEVIQAGDDKTTAELNLNRLEVDTRLAGWNVLKSRSKLEGEVKKWASLKPEAE